MISGSSLVSRGACTFRQARREGAAQGRARCWDRRRPSDMVDRGGKIIIETNGESPGRRRRGHRKRGAQRVGRSPKWPKYTEGFVDRHGKPRFYLRRIGMKRVPLPGLPWSPEFMQAYTAATADTPPARQIGVKRTTPGTVNAALVGYYTSSEFLALRPETQRTRRNILERFRNEHGEKRIAKIERAHVSAMLAARAHTPAAARNFLKTLRALMQFAVGTGLPPTIRPPRSRRRAFARPASTPGPRMRSPPLRPRTRLAVGPGSRLAFSSTRPSASRTS